MTKIQKNKTLSGSETQVLLTVLQNRFEKNSRRHPGIDWSDVEKRLLQFPGKLWSLNEMESTGGEPDVVGRLESVGEFLFYDCSPESPAGRRSVCYDRQGLESRKEHRPSGNALDMAEIMGVEVMDEAAYRHLQTLGNFDTKTSSWLKTPPEIRQHGGAIFGDFRYGTVFIYHNGAQSYYAARGFRGVLRV